MAIERMPGFDSQVGRSEAAEHHAMMASPTFAYRLGVGAGGAVDAFAILRGLGDPRQHARCCDVVPSCFIRRKRKCAPRSPLLGPSHLA